MYDNKNKCAAFYVIYTMVITWYISITCYQHGMLILIKKESILIKHKIIIITN